MKESTTSISLPRNPINEDLGFGGKMNLASKLLSLSLLLLTASSVSSSDLKGFNPAAIAPEAACNFIPPNNQRFPIRPNSGQLSQNTFNQIIKTAEAVYDPMFVQAGLGRFKILPLWENDDVNAKAFVCDPEKMPNGVALGNPLFNCNKVLTTAPNVKVKSRVVEMYGGLARHPLMTAEGFLLVICHEIGHHLGGAPRYPNSELSTEGQSDYFSTSKCARQILSRVNNNDAWVRAANVPLEVRIPCQNSFPNNALQSAICMRSSMGGLSLARVLASFKSDWRLVGFSKKDTNVVAQTYPGHPAAQCRLDTYFSGALCRASENVSFDGKDYRRGSCFQKNLRELGTRPECWFKPTLPL